MPMRTARMNMRSEITNAVQTRVSAHEADGAKALSRQMA